MGLLGMAMWQGLAYVAAETTSATNMGILAAMVPLLTVLLSALIAMALLGERIAPYHLAGGALVLAGVIMAQRLTRPLSRFSHAG